ncbi:TrbI F-type domain-containing protein [Pseudomonas sp.]|uniref:TrbI F-type domain-containing protein n=1 Tax=Pseudomonas sp. TaxID=306 RepID=UPI003D0B6AA9
MIGVIGGLCWMAWATKNIVDSVQPKHQFVKLQLQGVMTEYLQAQARSGSDDQTAAAATTRFMAELDKAVADVSKSGRVVLVNEAVVGGDIPDITAQVKKAVYSKVPMPKVAAATPVVQDMQAYLAANAGQNAPAGSPLGTVGAAGDDAQ